MKHFSLFRILLGAVLFTVLAQIVHMLDGMLGMKYYIDPNYFSVWSKIMMPNAGPPPASFYYMSIGFAFLGALLFTVVYALLKNGLPGKTNASKGLIYGLLLFFVAGIPTTLTMILIINLPFGLICLWTAEDFVIKLVGGLLVGATVKEKR